MFRSLIRPALALTVLLCAITGLAYPSLVTALAQTLFPRQARGSLLEENGRVVGSALLGQRFTRPEYFHGRPSAANYDAMASGGTNEGPLHRSLRDAITVRVDSAVAEGAQRGTVPADMVTPSASGLDPHISPANARLQVARVARARVVEPSAIQSLVDQYIEGRQFGFLGEPRINVLLLNLAVDSAYPVQKDSIR